MGVSETKAEHLTECSACSCTHWVATIVTVSVVPPAGADAWSERIDCQVAVGVQGINTAGCVIWRTKDSVPVNRVPSLHTPLNCATTLPGGAVLGTAGFGGLLIIPGNVPFGTYATS
jgi:hypothetical protein